MTWCGSLLLCLQSGHPSPNFFLSIAPALAVLSANLGECTKNIAIAGKSGKARHPHESVSKRLTVNKGKGLLEKSFPLPAIYFFVTTICRDTPSPLFCFLAALTRERDLHCKSVIITGNLQHKIS